VARGRWRGAGGKGQVAVPSPVLNKVYRDWAKGKNMTCVMVLESNWYDRNASYRNSFG
jgi:hypothetical protein